MKRIETITYNVRDEFKLKEYVLMLEKQPEVKSWSAKPAKFSGFLLTIEIDMDA